MLQINSLCFSYSGGADALNHVHLSLPRGQIVGLLGENGAGKSTLIRCILGLLCPKSGSVTLDGASGEAIRTDMAYVSSDSTGAIGGLTPRQMGAFLAEYLPNFRTRRYEQLLEYFELPDRRISTFSTGQRTKAELAAGCCRGASYLLMDEPFLGKDVFTRRDFLRILAGNMTENETILISSHLVEEIESTIDRAVILHHGCITADVEMDALRESGNTLLELLAEKTGRKQKQSFILSD